MTQAQLQAIITEVQLLKSEIRNYMSTTELEKTNLEAHVDLCSERYKGLHDRLSAIEVRLGKMNEEMTAGHKSQTKTIIATAGTVVAGLSFPPTNIRVPSGLNSKVLKCCTSVLPSTCLVSNSAEDESQAVVKLY